MLFTVNAPVLELARLADAPRIAAMSRDLIEAGFAHSWTAERVARHIGHRESVVLVARRTAELLGFGIMHYGDDSAHLNLFAVASHARRRGLGRRILVWLEETAFTAGTFVIDLELRAGNAAALAFYRSLGYREAGRMRGYYQGVEDAIRMVRDVRAQRGSVPAP